MRQYLIFLFVWAIVFWGAPSPSWARQVSTSDPVEDATLLRVQDSLEQQAAMSKTLLLRPELQNIPNQLIDSLKADLLKKSLSWQTMMEMQAALKPVKTQAPLRAQRDGWILGVVGLLLSLLCVVRLAFPGDFHVILQAGFNDRILGQINKEYNLYSSWPFVFLYLIFAGATGLFIYLMLPNTFQGVSRGGFQSFLGITLLVFILFTLKIICTRIIGYLFDLQKVVREYVSVLYICYFHVGLICLAVGSIACLTPPEGLVFLRIFVWVILLGFFGFRLGKTFLHLMQTYKLSVFYLFVYLCILEIAPILILINVLSKN